jgi:WD40 repeat protein
VATYIADGARVIAGDWDGNVNEWDSATGELRRTFRVPERAGLTLPNHDGSRVTVAGGRSNNLWDAASGQPAVALDLPMLSWAAVSHDGRTVAAVSVAGDVKLFDATSGIHEATFPIDGSEKTAVAFSADAKELAVGNGNGLVYLLDRASGRLKQVIPAHPGYVGSVSYGSDGSHLVTTGFPDRTAKLWDAANGGLLLTIPHDDDVTRASLSGDGAWIATAGRDIAWIWDARNGELMRRIPGPTYTAHFSPASTELLTTGDRGYAVIWDVTLDRRSPDELAAVIAERSPWELVQGRLRLRATSK